MSICRCTAVCATVCVLPYWAGFGDLPAHGRLSSSETCSPLFICLGSPGPRGRACRPLVTCRWCGHVGPVALAKSTGWNEAIGCAGGCLFRGPVVTLSDLRCSSGEPATNSSRPDEGNPPSMPHRGDAFKSTRSGCLVGRGAAARVTLAGAGEMAWQGWVPGGAGRPGRRPRGASSGNRPPMSPLPTWYRHRPAVVPTAHPSDDIGRMGREQFDCAVDDATVR